MTDMNKKTKIGAVLIWDNKLLVLERNPARSYTGWGLITGNIDPHEEKEKALTREVCEETGICLDHTPTKHFYTSTYWSNRYSCSYTIYWFVCIFKQEPHLTLQEEEWLQYAWVPLHDANNHLYWPSEQEVIKQLLNLSDGNIL